LIDFVLLLPPLSSFSVRGHHGAIDFYIGGYLAICFMFPPSLPLRLTCLLLVDCRLRSKVVSSGRCRLFCRPASRAVGWVFLGVSGDIQPNVIHVSST
jgi:hypothetical protein